MSPGLPGLPGPSVAGASMVHMNGDAVLDMVQFHRAAYSAIIRVGSGFGRYQAPVIIYADGLGTLSSPTTLSPPATECRNVVIADFNRDGVPDIIAQDGATYYEIRGVLSGVPSSYTTRTLSFGALDMKVGEAASDGRPYLYLTWNNQGLDVYSVSTTGVLTPIESHFVLVGPYTMALADMDRDGQVDVVSVGSSTHPWPSALFLSGSLIGEPELCHTATHGCRAGSLSE